LHRYDVSVPKDSLKVEEIDEPKVEGPLDVIVRVGAAGLCRTDIHIIEGQWKPIQDPDGTLLPYTLGHENSGWIEEVGPGVTNVEVGDTVICHPLMTCGLCRACRAGDDMHCENGEFPGLSRDGGFADLLKTNARAVVKLDPVLEPKDIAALADAGLTPTTPSGSQYPTCTRARRLSLWAQEASATSASSASRRSRLRRSSSPTRTRRRWSSPKSGARTRR
jgi:NAD+-dependent secondary alcohol dehydrogenase Adh1